MKFCITFCFLPRILEPIEFDSNQKQLQSFAIDELPFPCRRRKHFTSSCHWFFFHGMALKIGASCLYESASGGGRKEMKVVALRIDGYCQVSHSFLTIFWARRETTISLWAVVAFLYVSVHPIDAVSRGTF